MAASALVERVLANTTGLLTRIQWAPIAIILLSYILKAYVVYVDIRRCHCFP